MAEKMHPKINIGLMGHVDHGKTTLVEALTDKWVSKYSEEKKRGITIRLGYTDFTIYQCQKCKKYCTSKKCMACFSDCSPIKMFSLIDAPGHESLIPIVLSGAALFDAAILVIAANEVCPQPQTKEHLRALQVGEVKNIIVVQNKVDLITREEAEKHHKQIKDFLKGTIAENAPIIPLSAQQKVGLDFLISELMSLEEHPAIEGDPLFLIARSFDANKPGIEPEELSGGVIGGSVIRGKLKKGEKIILKPVLIGGKYIEIETKIKEIRRDEEAYEEATSGGLVAIQTSLDPSLAKSDKLVGCIAGNGKMPPTIQELVATYTLFEKYEIKSGDTILITCRNSRSTGSVGGIDKKQIKCKLNAPLCADKGSKISYSKLIDHKWRLIGWGVIE
ncbi:MAG: translation initiation factor IF-2 subunit gamma [Candidatus Aenigmarchaeota archaeon]|nr:translation initiation factor IF-2 subunit gamma [Candidatus Aenigmarchaeota archaeon]